ncbi:MAG TPA: sugar transferase [Verrucomicrobiae bacterium]|nr:sugar transferase [Verrucomicrobiae bacterium]
MTQGVPYAFGPEKRLFDIGFAGLFLPVAYGARTLLSHTLKDMSVPDNNPDFYQERSGVNREPFGLHKLRTLNSETGEPLNRLAEFMRKNGIDETIQARQVWRGVMSAVGRRPVQPREEEAILSNGSPKLVAQYERIVLPTKTGMIDSFCILNHSSPNKIETMIANADLKLEMNIEDVLRGSWLNDASIFATALRAAAQGRL